MVLVVAREEAVRLLVLCLSFSLRLAFAQLLEAAGQNRTEVWFETVGLWCLALAQNLVPETNWAQQGPETTLVPDCPLHIAVGPNLED